MLLEQTYDKLIAMKLYGMANALKTRLERVDHQSLTKEEFFSLIVDDEWLYRENRKLVSRLKVAKFKERAAAIEDIDYRTPRGLRKTQVLELAQHRWIKAHQCVIVTGPSGVGKSYLAQAFGHHACRNGFSVQYLRLPTLLTQFVQARAQGTYERLLKRLGKLSLLVIDDFGLATLTDIEKQDLLEAVEERYGTGATLITSQLPVSDWHAYLGADRVADAILDRLIHNAHRIELRSKESLRKDPSLNPHGGHPER
ncbi:IS21-like element helper ATPase IstB [Luteitalea sp.]|uniref:IS21-like element helper ATPase IstB n=1 Tax=Luteitalea sp. TaxID=2004800 RepID=UPI0025B9F483|nr:IS21-like element helper ATPase IstB [Luteitalea sp.]